MEDEYSGDEDGEEEEDVVEFAPDVPSHHQGGGAGGYGAVDPGLEKKVAQLVQALKQYKEKVVVMKGKIRTLVDEKKSLKEACEKLEEEKQEVELKVSIHGGFV